METEKESKAFRVWKEDNTELSAKVWTRYTQLMDGFMKENNIATFEDLYQMKIEDNKSADARDANKVERLIKGYFTILQTKGIEHKLKDGPNGEVRTKVFLLKPQTALHFVKACQSFFTSQKLDLDISHGDFEIEESMG
ncbi:MAG: hypothetical protein NTV61_05880, partial [Candidatus Bathyarchaeota archaeon]|nr:hypothetical protein [Candidatus Bathyarchaeota archaeon]